MMLIDAYCNFRLLLRFGAFLSSLTLLVTIFPSAIASC